jgi:transposase
MRSVALDVGARKISFCEVADGAVVKRRTVASLDALADVLGAECQPSRVAIEACREAWYLHARLTGWGNHVLLVDTTRSRQLGIGHGRKTDRIDAEILARAVEQNRIPEAHLLSPARRKLRGQLGIRQAVVETRAQYVTTIRGLIRASGAQIPPCDTRNFVEKIRRTQIDDATRALVSPLVALLEQIEQQLALVEQQLERLCAAEPIIARLTTVPGVGMVIAAAFVSVVDDAHRFRDAHQVQAYIGLVPSEDSSGDRRRIGSITKRGNPYLRSLLVQAAWVTMGLRTSDDPLRSWAKQVAARRGRRIAVVALARRLVGVLWAMWRRGTVYDPALVGNCSADGLAKHARSIDLHAEAMKRSAAKARVGAVRREKILRASSSKLGEKKVNAI